MSVKSLVWAGCPSFLRPAFERIENSPIGYRLAKGVFWSMAGLVISRGLMLAATVLVARMLGKTVYGELGMIQSTVGMFGVFAGFGLGLTATKYVAEFRQSDPARAGRIIGLSGLFAMLTSGLMALGLFIFAPWLAEHTINAPHLAGVLRIGALILFISGINGAQTGALSGFEAFKMIAYVNLFVGLISFPILVCGAWFGGLTGAVSALAINLCFNWLLNHLALRKEARRFGVPFTLRQCPREWPILWRFSLPATLSGMLVGPVNWGCSAMLVNQSNGYGEMGVYSAAHQWFNILVFLPALLCRVMLPVISERLARNDTKQSTEVVTLTVKSNAFFVFPFVLLGSVFSHYIMSLYGHDFRDGWPTLVVVLLTTGVISMQIPIGNFVAASGKMWAEFAMSIAWASIMIASSSLLIHFGSLGLALAGLLSYSAHCGWSFLFVVWLIRKKAKYARMKAENLTRLADLTTEYST